MAEKTSTARSSGSQKTVTVNGSSMAYVEQGSGEETLLFIHGVPTSSYLWRNVLPKVQDVGRCIAVDLIGFGDSAKPDIDYSVFDHIAYLTAFIEALQLKNLTLVMHGWGSVVGFGYALQHPEKIKRLAFLEAHLRPVANKAEIALPIQEFLLQLDKAENDFSRVLHSNQFIVHLLRAGVLRPLTDEEMAAYQRPFPDPGSRRPILRFLQELPFCEGDAEVNQLIQRYSDHLQCSDVPKLMLYAIPGFNTTMETVAWARDHLPNLTLADLEDALHFAPESNPELFSQRLKEWLFAEKS